MRLIYQCAQCGARRNAVMNTHLTPLQLLFEPVDAVDVTYPPLQIPHPCNENVTGVAFLVGADVTLYKPSAQPDGDTA